MGYVDSHTHLWFAGSLEPALREKVYGLTNIELGRLRVEDAVAEMDRYDIEFAVIMAYPSRRLWGTREDFPVRLIGEVKRFASRFAVFGGVEPSALSVEEAKAWLERQYEAGVSGFKVHPPHMWVKPNAYREEEGGLAQLRAVYEFAEDHGLPVTIHTGTSSFPEARNKYGDPVFVDDVAVDFPRLKLVMAHLGRPNWVATAFQLVRIRPNLYSDLSGIPPRRLLEYAPRAPEASSKLLYGSDYGSPGVPGIGRSLSDFLALPMPEEAKKEIAEHTPKSLVRTLAQNL